MYSIPKIQKLAIVDAMIAMTEFTGAIIKLSTANFTPNQNTVIGDFVEATFTGYAPSSAVTWGTAHLAPNGDGVSVGSAKTFICTGTAVTEIVYTWWLETALGDYLLGGAFDTPINFANTGDGVTVVPTVAFKGT